MRIRASGGIVFRGGAVGAEILIVHRPRYDDWSLPKGKDEPGETAEQAALREVGEETGLDPFIVSNLGEVHYTTPKGDTKTVTYFAMRAVGGIPFLPNDEVDEISWVAVEEALEILTYRHDRELLSSLDLESYMRSGTLYLVRHGSAGSRSQRNGDDRTRPLTPKGVAQANRIAEWLRRKPLDVIMSSPYLRCVQTVEPLARSTGLPLNTHPLLAEGTSEAVTMIYRIKGLNAVVCTHGDVIPAMLESMAAQGMALSGDPDCKKGSTWVVTVAESRFVSARYLASPTS